MAESALGAQVWDQHEIVLTGGKKFLRVSIKNNYKDTCELKLSQVTYRWYEPIEDLPIIEKVAPGASFVHDFSFRPEAWVAKPTRMPNDVELSFVCKSASGDMRSSNVNNPSPGLTYVDHGPESNFLYLSDLKEFPMPRNLEVRIISVKVKGKERLQNPYNITIKPGGQVRVPNVTPKEEPVIKFATRLVPNKRWSIQSTQIEYFGTQ